MAAWLPWLLFLVSLAAASGRTMSPALVIRTTHSCPEVGYYFKRDMVSNALNPGPCYLCFCQTNGTALCWMRENRRCDMQFNQIGGRKIRLRRSPIGLSDIFFRDAAREYTVASNRYLWKSKREAYNLQLNMTDDDGEINKCIGTQLPSFHPPSSLLSSVFNRQAPTECKPFESSFSDGCPPVDWCTGCTICDCDANGHWDCHILSFCNGKERKEKVKNPHKNRLGGKTSIKNTAKANQKNNHGKANNPKPNEPKPKQTSKPKAVISKPALVKNKDQSYVPVKPRNLSKNQKKPQNKPSHIKAVRSYQNNQKPNPAQRYQKNIKRNNQGEVAKTGNPIKKRVKKIIIRKPMKGNQNDGATQQNPSVSTVKTTKRDELPQKPVQDLLQGMNMQKLLNNNNDSLKLGQKIVKQIMSSVQKILKREMEKIDEARKSRSVNYKDCPELKKFEKEAFNIKSNAAARNKNKYNTVTANLKNLEHERKKREVLNETQAVMAQVNIISLEQTGNTAVIPLPIKTHIKLLNNSTISALSGSTEPPNQYYKYSYKENTIDANLNATNQIYIENRNQLLANAAKLPENKTTVNNSVVKTTLAPITTYATVILDVKLSNDTNKMNTHDTTKIVENSTHKSNQSNNSSKSADDVKLIKWVLIKLIQNKTKRPIENLRWNKNKFKDELLPSAMKIDLKMPMANLAKKKTTPKENVSNKTFYDVTETVNLYSKLVSDFTPPDKFTKKPMEKVDSLPNLLQNLISFFKQNATKIPKNNVQSNTGMLKKLRTFFNKIMNRKAIPTRSNKYGMGPKEERTLQILCDHFVTCKIKRKNKFILKYKLKRLNEESDIILKSIKIIKGLLHLLDPPGNYGQSFDSNKTLNTNSLYKFQKDLRKFNAILKGIYNSDNLTETQKFQILYIKKNTQVFKESVRRFANILKEILVILKEDTSKNRYIMRQGNSTTPLVKIKSLLTKYNLVQNSFISKMFQLLKKLNDSDNDVKRQTQVSEDNNLRTDNDKVFTKYSKNIIDNLRKLKSLTQELNFKRSKRHTVAKRDDAIEYLLTLLEFLLKKQSDPLDYSPENDGIDLLIDAIKNAPDIKPIEKKVLEHRPVPSVTTTKFSEGIVTRGDSSDSEADNNLNQTASKGDDNFIKDAKSKVYYVTAQVTEAYSEISSPDYTDFIIDNKRTDDNLFKDSFDKFDSSADDIKKIVEEVDVVENLRPTLIPTSKGTEPANRVIPTDNIAPMAMTTRKVENNKYSISRETEESEVNEEERKLEWVEAAFDVDERDFGKDNVTQFATPNATEKPGKISKESVETKEVSTGMDNLSAYIAKPEASIEKIRPEEVMERKQMELLRSLDYGKSDAYDVDAKDYPSRSDDLFSSYF